MTKAFFTFLSISWFMAFPLTSEGKTATIFKVLSVRGIVITRTATALHWSPVRKGAVLSEGQMIQVMSNAAVTITDKPGQAGASEVTQTTMTLSKPIVTRVSSDLLRHIELSSFFVTQPLSPPLPPLSELGILPLTLRDAWNRLAVTISNIPRSESPQKSLTELEQLGIDLGVAGKRLHVVTPTSNSVLYSNNWPVEVKVIWVKPKDAITRYNIYAWPTESPREGPVGATRQDFYTIKIWRPGTYFIQVMSGDGSWRSPAVVIQALAPLDKTIIAADGDATHVAVAAVPIPQYPPDKFALSPKQSPTLVVLAWEMERTNENHSFQLKLMDAAGKTLRTVLTKAQETSLALEPGTYSWSVAVEGSKEFSAASSFQIIDPLRSATSALRLQLLQTLISSGKDSTLRLDDGI